MSPTGKSEDKRLDAFVRPSAVFAGLANAAVFSLGAGKPLGDAFSHLAVLYALSAVAAGLLASEIVLRFVRGGLRGDFYARHRKMALAACVGGALLGALLVSVSVLADGAIPVADRLVGALAAAPIAGFAGGWLGFAEGLLLGPPLAAFLGLFRGEGCPRPTTP